MGEGQFLGFHLSSSYFLSKLLLCKAEREQGLSNEIIEKPLALK